MKKLGMGWWWNRLSDLSFLQFWFGWVHFSISVYLFPLPLFFCLSLSCLRAWVVQRGWGMCGCLGCHLLTTDIEKEKETWQQEEEWRNQGNRSTLRDERQKTQGVNVTFDGEANFFNECKALVPSYILNNPSSEIACMSNAGNLYLTWLIYA